MKLEAVEIEHSYYRVCNKIPSIFGFMVANALPTLFDLEFHNTCDAAFFYFDRFVTR